jgi:nucleoside-diphosphate-sugar epimerase
MNWRTRRVLVTGAGGFIGSHLTERLVVLGARTTCFVRYNSRNDWGLLELLPRAVRDSLNVVSGDLKDADALCKTVRKCDFVDVRDVVRAYWRIVARGRAGEIYNVCSGTAYAVKDVLNSLLRISGLKTCRIVPMRKKTRAVDIPESVGDAWKIRRDTGWRPAISLEQTLTDLLR